MGTHIVTNDNVRTLRFAPADGCAVVGALDGAGVAVVGALDGAGVVGTWLGEGVRCSRSSHEGNANDPSPCHNFCKSQYSLRGAISSRPGLHELLIDVIPNQASFTYLSNVLRSW